MPISLKKCLDILFSGQMFSPASGISDKDSVNKLEAGSGHVYTKLFGSQPYCLSSDTD